MIKQILKTTCLFSVDDEMQDDRFCKVRIAAMHSGKNLNKSRFSVETITDAKDLFKNIPILAEVKKYTDEDGNEKLDYTSHAFHIEDDFYNPDEQRIIYDEVPVGTVPETCNFELKYDEESGNYYVWVDAYLYREYANYCVDILQERNGLTDVSMEIDCYDVSFDASDDTMNVNKMIPCGITLLGDSVNPGMKKAHASMAFAKEKYAEEMVKLNSELNSHLESFNINKNSMKGGTAEDMTLFEKLLKKYGKTVEEIMFEYEGLTDDELTEAFAKAFEVEVSDGSDAPVADEGGEPVPTEETVVTTDEPVVELNSYTYSISNKDGIVKEFQLSLDEKIDALYTLVNSVYGEADDAWYGVTAYESNLIMHNWETNQYYRQDYTQDGDTFSLVGEREEVFAEFVTDAERNALTVMRASYDETLAKYAEVEAKLKKYEEEPEKLEIFAKKCYASIANTLEFTELAKQVNHFDLSVEDVTKRCDEILLSYAKEGKLDFASSDDEAKTKHTVTSVGIATKNTRNVVGRYGRTFAK